MSGYLKEGKSEEEIFEIDEVVFASSPLVSSVVLTTSPLVSSVVFTSSPLVSSVVSDHRPRRFKV